MKQTFVHLLLLYFRFWAQRSLKVNKPVVVGITGSVGKSSERNAVYAVLKDYFPTKMIEKGNSEIGIPLGILGLSVNSLGFQTPLRSVLDFTKMVLSAPRQTRYLKGTKYLIIEMGVDEPYEPKNMGFLLKIVKPNVSIFLNTYAVHTQQFEVLIGGKTFKNEDEKTAFLVTQIAKEKGRIINESGCRTAIYNGDNEPVTVVVEEGKKSAPPARKYLSYSYSKKTDITITYYSATSEGCTFSFFVGNEKVTLHFDNLLLPKEYGEIFAAAMLVGKSAGLTVSQTKESLEKNYTVPHGRSSLLHGVNDAIIIDSSYNASRRPTLAFLDLAYTISKKEKRPMVFVMGDMRELGSRAQTEHLAVTKKINEGVDYLYTVGPLTKEYVVPNVDKKQIKEVKSFENAYELGKYLKENMPKKAIVLVKGSQNTIFLEEAVKCILQNPKDVDHLARQEEFWMEKKKYMFE